MEKMVCLISGGIDSPVAAWMMMEKGYEVVFLYCQNRQEIENERVPKVRKIVEQLGGSELYIADNSDFIKTVVQRCEPSLRCVLCKRAMYRAAEKLAGEVGASGIVTGENLGQVASQTLANLAVLDSATSLPVVRPLLAMEKNETVELSKEIGTYGLSTEDTSRCPFVPEHPETHADVAEVRGEERLIEAVKLAQQTEFRKVTLTKSQRSSSGEM